MDESSKKSASVALAIFAHPDDIEFTCAGVLAILRERGVETHYLNVANGCCGSLTEDSETTKTRRWGETQAAAEILGAIPHPPLFNDLEIFYTAESTRKTSALLREIQPDIILTHAVDDYMEDHRNTARLALLGAFAIGMPNYKTDPEVSAREGHRCALYHALPHSLRRPADRRRVFPEFYVNVDDVIQRRRDALAAHRSQKEWLDQTQGMNAYLDTMTDFAKILGSESGVGTHAEGFTRHLPVGMGDEDFRPLETTLADLRQDNPNYPDSPPA